MKLRLIIIVLGLLFSSPGFSQNEYEPSAENPFGLPNPQAPGEIKDYAPMIGICDCKSIKRNQDGEWAAPIDMTWEFKYIMNGNAIQDQTLKSDGVHSGSIRQFNADSTSWYVHYYTTANTPHQLSSWKGNPKSEDIILYKDQKSPNGTEGKYKITFSEISEEGFNWLGQWVSLDESVKYPTWKIECVKRKIASDLSFEKE